MTQFKAQEVNWLDQGWRISQAIAELPDNPPGLLAPFKIWPPLTGTPKLLIELLQDHISAQLAYTLRVKHKVSFTLPDGDKAMFWPDSRDPKDTVKLMLLLAKIGVKLRPVDLWAFDAHLKLGRILLDRYVCKEWKRQLPLIVASIGGATTSETAKLKAKQPRPRAPNYLRVQKLRALELNPNYSWKQLLRHLQNLDIVVDWDEFAVRWLNESGNERRTSTVTFQKWAN